MSMSAGDFAHVLTGNVDLHAVRTSASTGNIHVRSVLSLVERRAIEQCQAD